MTDNQVEVAIGMRDGKVVFMFQHPTKEFSSDPQNAQSIAEEILRLTGDERTRFAMPVRQYITQERRTQLHARAVIVVRTLLESGKTPEYVAKHLTDIILNEVA